MLKRGNAARTKIYTYDGMAYTCNGCGGKRNVFEAFNKTTDITPAESERLREWFVRRHSRCFNMEV